MPFLKSSLLAAIALAYHITADQTFKLTASCPGNDAIDGQAIRADHGSEDLEQLPGNIWIGGGAPTVFSLESTGVDAPYPTQHLVALINGVPQNVSGPGPLTVSSADGGAATYEWKELFAQKWNGTDGIIIIDPFWTHSVQPGNNGTTNVFTNLMACSADPINPVYEVYVNNTADSAIGPVMPPDALEDCIAFVPIIHNLTTADNATGEDNATRPVPPSNVQIHSLAFSGSTFTKNLDSIDGSLVQSTLSDNLSNAHVVAIHISTIIKIHERILIHPDNLALRRMMPSTKDTWHANCFPVEQGQI